MPRSTILFGLLAALTLSLAFVTACDEGDDDNDDGTADTDSDTDTDTDTEEQPIECDPCAEDNPFACSPVTQDCEDGEACDYGYETEDSGKLARLGELCESIAARQDKVLVFTQFREMTRPLADFLSEVFGRGGSVLHGGTPVNKRQRLVKSFQDDDRVPFMVLSLKAGGIGLNLTAASHVIHFDRWWNPAVENQATDRAFRIGQQKNVLVHKFVCRGTVEERIDDLVADKQKLSDKVLSGGGDSALTEMSNEELISMVSLDLSSALEG